MDTEWKNKALSRERAIEIIDEVWNVKRFAQPQWTTTDNNLPNNNNEQLERRLTR